MSPILESSDRYGETVARTSQFSYYNISAHKIDYVKYGGFVLKFMSSALSVTYR